MGTEHGDPRAMTVDRFGKPHQPPPHGVFARGSITPSSAPPTVAIPSFPGNLIASAIFSLAREELRALLGWSANRVNHHSHAPRSAHMNTERSVPRSLIAVGNLHKARCGAMSFSPTYLYGLNIRPRSRFPLSDLETPVTTCLQYAVRAIGPPSRHRLHNS